MLTQAAFLVAMGEHSYYVCGTWANYPANASTWSPVYDLPLGSPLTNATLGGLGLVLRRAPFKLVADFVVAAWFISTLAFGPCTLCQIALSSFCVKGPTSSPAI